MAARKTTSPRTRSKTELQEEFADIRKNIVTQEVPDAKALELQRQHEALVREGVRNLTAGSVIQEITAVRLKLSQALSEISDTLVEKVTELSQVQEAVALSQKEVAQIHQIDIAATSLDQLVRDYEEKNRQLDTEIASKRLLWQQEQQERERERKDQEELAKKSRNREVEDYHYRIALERKKEQDAYEEQRRIRDKADADRAEQLNKTWKERELALKTQEDELARLKKESADFPTRLEQAVNQAVLAEKQSNARSYAFEVNILKKDAEVAQKLAEQKISSLQEAIQKQQQTIDTLQKQLTEASAKIENIATKAIDGASASRALSEVKSMGFDKSNTRS